MIAAPIPHWEKKNNISKLISWSANMLGQQSIRVAYAHKLKKKIAFPVATHLGTFWPFSIECPRLLRNGIKLKRWINKYSGVWQAKLDFPQRFFTENCGKHAAGLSPMIVKEVKGNFREFIFITQTIKLKLIENYKKRFFFIF